PRNSNFSLSSAPFSPRASWRDELCVKARSNQPGSPKRWPSAASREASPESTVAADRTALLRRRQLRCRQLLGALHVLLAALLERPGGSAVPKRAHGVCIVLRIHVDQAEDVIIGGVGRHCELGGLLEFGGRIRVFAAVKEHHPQPAVAHGELLVLGFGEL